MSESAASEGCAPAALGLLLGFAAIEGGIVLAAWSLHQILGDPATFHPRAVTGAAAGVIILFAGPQLWFLATRSRPAVTWRQALAAVPDLALAGWFVVGWAAPQLIGRQAAGMLVGVMAMEFVIIHASVMLVYAGKLFPPSPQRPWWQGERAVTGGLLLLYSLLAAGISAGFSAPWLFAGFWMLIGNKFIGDWLAPAGEAEERMRRHLSRWALSAGLYLLLAMGSIFIPVPRLGALSASSGDGLWERHPEQAVAMGALYFALLGMCELYGAFNKAGAANPVQS